MYLPRKGIVEYSKGTIIFDEANPSQSLHLVVQGRVKYAAPLDNGRQTIVDIFNTDDFFGESCLLSSARHTEVATALDNVTLMSWGRRKSKIKFSGNRASAWRSCKCWSSERSITKSGFKALRLTGRPNA